MNRSTQPQPQTTVEIRNRAAKRACRALSPFASMIVWLGLLFAESVNGSDLHLPLSNAFPGHPSSQLVRIATADKAVTGLLVGASPRKIQILRRDGQLAEIDRSTVVRAEKVSGAFQPYTSLQMQQHLQKIFGKRYEVSRTSHYVVVHPRGLRAQWAEPFESSYRQFRVWFSARGFQLAEPRFPMIVIVAESLPEFARIARKDGLANPNAYAGYYSSTSNWVVTRATANSVEDRNTLIHESFHQFAFNTGLHQRWAETPRWCAEGLATLFESPGFHNSAEHQTSKDRHHRYWMSWLKSGLDRSDVAARLETLVADDRLFEENLHDAYGLSWGLSWYLAETRQAQLNNYLQQIAQRPRGQPYTRADRLAEFRQAFGMDFTMLASHFLKYVDDAR